MLSQLYLNTSIAQQERDIYIKLMEVLAKMQEHQANRISLTAKVL